MVDRRVLAGVALCALVFTSGCLGAITGGGSISEERLNQAPAEPYDWDADETAHITVHSNATFQAVYRVSGDEIELFRRDGLGSRNPIGVRAFRFRYANGTVVTAGEFEADGGSIEQTREAVVVTFPDSVDNASLAFTAGSTPKRFALPVFVEGEYELVLPPNRRVDFFLFGTVSPRADNRERVGDRVHLHWDDVTTDSILVQFYLQRDLQIFGVGTALLTLVALAGLAYYRRQIRRLEEQRQEMGLDVETEDDDFRDDPPPGMG